MSAAHCPIQGKILMVVANPATSPTTGWPVGSHAALLDSTQPIDDVQVEDDAALFVSGGQSPMVTFVEDEKLKNLVATFHAAQKPTALVCHATALLLSTHDAEGRLLVEGKRWTGFSDAEERLADQAVGQKIQPFWIEEEARRVPGTTFDVGPAFRPFLVVDGHLVTGQQQASGSRAAAKVMSLLQQEGG